MFAPAVGRIAGVEGLARTARRRIEQRNLPEAPVFVDQQRSAVGRPVGRLENAALGLNRGGAAGLDVDRLQRGDNHRLPWRALCVKRCAAKTQTDECGGPET
jgi:hypothetical protein